MKELQEVDLFENVDIDFSGIAPYAKAQVIDPNTDFYPGVKRYALDKEINLKAGKVKEIPQDILDKMTKQLEDALHAQVAKAWEEKDSLKSIKYVGSYLLVPKENQIVYDNNILYNIYKVSVENSENKFEFYTYCQFKDIIVLADGTCSVDLTSYIMPSGSAFFGSVSGEAFMKGSYYYFGYEETDSLFNNCVTKNIEQYGYESTVTE